MTLNIKSIEQFDVLPDSVMQAFERDIYLSPCHDSNEILTDLYENDLCHAIEFLVKAKGVFPAFSVINNEFKRVSGMELKI